ncbi:hypothetical protein GUU_00782, partial [Malacoplasma iowae 695]
MKSNCLKIELQKSLYFKKITLIKTQQQQKITNYQVIFLFVKLYLITLYKLL